MTRHDATSRVVQQSLFDIESDINPPVKRRSRSSTRYTSISVKPSNVTPMSRRRGGESGTNSTSQRSTSRNQSTKKTDKNANAEVISLHDSKRRNKTTRTPPSARTSARTRTTRASPRNNRQQNTRVIWYPKKRARVLALCLLIPFVAIMLRLIDVQVIHSHKYAALGVTQRRLVREITPDRGTITDRNGNILAASEPAYSVVADPSLIKDTPSLLRSLHKVTVFDDSDVVSGLKNKKSRYAMIVRQVDKATAKRVQNKNLPGISVIKDSKRDYPARDVAANVVGFVGTEMKGLGGLEFSLNKTLSGTAGKEVIERDPKGREIPSTRRDVQRSVRGDDVTTTIDQGIQYEAQRVVTQEVAATKSKGGVAIIADVHTGEILSMVSVTGGPDNPQPSSASDLNHAVTDVYEPGSTNKVITVSGALEEHLISPGTTFNVPDSISFDHKDFVDAESHDVETMTPQDIISKSSNVGTIMIGQLLKRTRLDNYLRSYGFGKKTALNFPGEASGILLAPKDYSDTSMATVPTGNGLAVTPMQMLSVYMTIANGGIKVDPRLIKGFVDSEGKRTNTDVTGSKRVISNTTAKQVQAMLRGVVENGTGKLASIPGYSVAGKTGTARKPPYEHPPYKYVSSFVGFAPASNPRLAAIVVLDEPQGNVFGGTIAAPVFERVMQSALRVMAIAPDQEVQGQTVTNQPSVTTTTSTLPVTTTIPRD